MNYVLCIHYNIVLKADHVLVFLEILECFHLVKSCVSFLLEHVLGTDLIDACLDYKNLSN